MPNFKNLRNLRIKKGIKKRQVFSKFLEMESSTKRIVSELPTWLTQTQREFIAVAAQIPKEELDQFRVHARGSDSDDEGEAHEVRDLEARDKERKERRKMSSKRLAHNKTAVQD